MKIESAGNVQRCM